MASIGLNNPLSGGGLAHAAARTEADLAALERELEHTESALRQLGTDIDHLHAQLTTGFVQYREVTITQSQSAYPLVEPKLMIAVNNLTGGPVYASFDRYTHNFSIGERFDFAVKECDCFLLLQASELGRATFLFGCERRTDSQNT